jgi:hypothetical protein
MICSLFKYMNLYILQAEKPRDSLKSLASQLSIREITGLNLGLDGDR